jgi:hypothetical protein
MDSYSKALIEIATLREQERIIGLVEGELTYKESPLRDRLIALIKGENK